MPILKTPWLLVLLVNLLSYGQSDTLRVIDSESGEAIPFAYIIMGSEKRVTGPEGYFSINIDQHSSDTVEFRCFGYDNLALIGTELQEQDEVSLSPSAMQLQTLITTAKGRRFRSGKLGVTSSPKTMFLDHYLTGKTGDLKAVWIPNKKGREGYIRKVNVYITDFGFPEAYFRLHVYECAPGMIKPGKELTTQNIVKQGLGNAWATIDLDISIYPFPRRVSS